MIQRIQTIWLFLATICAVLTYLFSFYSGNKVLEDGTKEFGQLNASTDALLMVLTAVLGLMTLVAIFLYKDRKVQLRLTIAGILLSVINIIIYFARTKDFWEGNILLYSVFAFIIPLLLMLAAQGIWRDEKLVKSLDRIR